MSAWQIWTILGVLLLVAEMFTPGFWLACLAVGAFAGGVVGLLPGVGTTVEVIVASVTSLASMVGLRPILMRRFRIGTATELRTNVDALLGKTGVVTERIEGGGGGRQGRVVVEGENWRGALLEKGVLEPGTRVMVVQVDGTTLLVEKEPES
jgi:membrane protein implicated in regulation of membrane protease activity